MFLFAPLLPGVFRQFDLSVFAFKGVDRTANQPEDFTVDGTPLISRERLQLVMQLFIDVDAEMLRFLFRFLRPPDQFLYLY